MHAFARPRTPQPRAQDIINTNGTTTSILAVSSALPHRMRRPRWSLDDYQLLKQLHKGYASDVYQVRRRRLGGGRRAAGGWAAGAWLRWVGLAVRERRRKLFTSL